MQYGRFAILSIMVYTILISYKSEICLEKGKESKYKYLWKKVF